ncbi:MAG: DoxX family protein [Phycisphaerales bacterium]
MSSSDNDDRSSRFHDEGLQYMTLSNAQRGAPAPSRARLWTGRVLSVVPSLLLLVGGAMNLAQTKDAVEGAAKYGYPESAVFPLGVTIVVCTLLYLIPRTSTLGAILLTGYLGGAVATHVRASDPVAFVVLPAVFGAVLWLGLLLREPRLSAVLPLRR